MFMNRFWRPDPSIAEVWTLAIALFHEAQENIKTSLDAQCCTAVMRACAEGMETGGWGLRSGSGCQLKGI